MLLRGPHPPPRGDQLSGVPAMLVVAVARPFAARACCTTMHPAAPSVHGVVRHFSPLGRDSPAGVGNELTFLHMISQQESNLYDFS